VIDMTAGPQGLALVSTIINLAHALNLKVVAEGVETEEQSRLLRLLSCDEMQGFYSVKRCRARASKPGFWPRLPPGDFPARSSSGCGKHHCMQLRPAATRPSPRAFH